MSARRSGILFSPALAPARAAFRWLRRLGREIAEGLGDTWWNGLVAAPMVPPLIRGQLLRLRPRTSLGADVLVMSGCQFDRNPLRFGNRVLVNRGVRFLGCAEIVIEREVAIGFEAMIVTVSHDGEHEDRRGALGMEKPIHIGAGAWIGARAILLPGCEIGEGCIIGAGAVVTGRCEPHKLYAGVPARPVRDLTRGKFHLA